MFGNICLAGTVNLYMWMYTHLDKGVSYEIIFFFGGGGGMQLVQEHVGLSYFLGTF